MHALRTLLAGPQGAVLVLLLKLLHILNDVNLTELKTFNL